jgi:hypothetical protein
MRIRLNKKTKLSVLLYYYRNIELYLMLLDLQISKPNIILCLRGRLSPSRRREAPYEGSNSPRLFTPGETKALAKSKVHQYSRASVTNDGWSSSLISKIWRTVMSSGHWLVQFKVCIITASWRQRNSKHFLIWSFLANVFHFWSHFCKIL